MLDKYGCELSQGDYVRVDGVFENIYTKNWAQGEFIRSEVFDGNPVAVVKGYEKRFNSQNITLLKQGASNGH